MELKVFQAGCVFVCEGGVVSSGADFLTILFGVLFDCGYFGTFGGF